MRQQIVLLLRLTTIEVPLQLHKLFGQKKRSDISRNVQSLS